MVNGLIDGFRTAPLHTARRGAKPPHRRHTIKWVPPVVSVFRLTHDCRRLGRDGTMNGYDDIDVEVVEMVEQALLPVDREDGLHDRPPEVAIAMIALERQHVGEEWL